MNIVIMAGGGGSRLWPVSRKDTPKQFLDLGTGKALIEHVYDRAKSLTAPESIFVATSVAYQEQIKKYLPDIPKQNVFYEPEKRDTLAAFANVATKLQEQGQGDEPTMHMWSDHVFTNEKKFLSDLKLVPELIEKHPDSIVIVGHTPVSPETTLGYMELGNPVEGHDGVYHVSQFKEKPDQKTAEQYVAAGNFYWNLGYFSAKPNYIIEELLRLNPELEAVIKDFHQIPKMAIDHALIEKTPRLIAITGDYGWSDIGNWAVMQEIFGDHSDHDHHMHVDSKDNYVFNTTKQAVSMIGMQDTIVVVTDDAILVTSKDHAPKVKKVVERLEGEGREELL